MNLKVTSGLAACVLAVSTIAFREAQADAMRGEALYANRCSGCHHTDINRTGPMHRGVVGRRVGGVRSFRYSPALKGSKLVWDAKLLGKWLADPEALFPGQDMGYAVIELQDRSDLIDYLTTLKAKR